MTARPMHSDFRCTRCGVFVSAQRLVSGVNNRNHCPACLWSRHLDLYAAGDRLSACKAPMQPVGLTVKPGHNKYASGGGELMLVHLCIECGRASINRLAADDDLRTVREVFSASFALRQGIHAQLISDGIRLLGEQEARVVDRQLLGSCASPLH